MYTNCAFSAFLFVGERERKKKSLPVRNSVFSGKREGERKVRDRMNSILNNRMPVHSRMVVSYSPFFFSGSELRETISELQTAAQCCAIEQPGVPLTWMTRQATSKRLETGKAFFHLADSTFSFVSPHRRRLASNACPRYLNDTTTTFAPLPKHLYN